MQAASSRRGALVPAGRVIGTATISWYWMFATDSMVVAMANTDQLRDGARRLLAMAISAREKGQPEYAERLTEPRTF